MKIIFAYIAVVLISSTLPLVIKLSVENSDLLSPLILRTFIGFALSMLALSFLKEKLSFNRKAMKVYLSSILGLIIATIVTYWSTQFISSGLVAVLYGLSPIVVGLLAMPILKDPFFSSRQLLGISSAVIGLVVIVYDELSIDNEGWKGIVGILVAVTSSALSIVLIKRLNVGMSGLSINAGSSLLSIPLFILMIFLFDYDVPEKLSPTVIYATVYLGIFGSFIGYVLQLYVLKRISVTNVALMSLMIPVLALLLGSVLNNEVISSHVIVGVILILIGLLVYQLPSIGGRINFQKWIDKSG